MEDQSKKIYLCPGCDQEVNQVVNTKNNKFDPQKDYICEIRWCKCKFKPIENLVLI